MKTLRLLGCGWASGQRGAAASSLASPPLSELKRLPGFAARKRARGREHAPVLGSPRHRRGGDLHRRDRRLAARPWYSVGD